MIAIKTQTQRSTKYLDKIYNTNLFIDKDLEIGCRTTKYWGKPSDPLQNPIIELTVYGREYSFSADDFKEIIQDAYLRKNH